ncbi:small heat shock protein [Suillus ampliporus]|nr:small heat shock protein [Suillus ampliporus]
MSISRTVYDPFAEFDRLFDENFSTRFSNTTNRYCNLGPIQRLERPRMDLHENAETKTVTAVFELPGLKREDVAVHVQSDCFTVSGDLKLSRYFDEGGYKIRERPYGKFSRTIYLPKGTQAEDVKAKMENGVLSVFFPNPSPEKSRRIAIA